MLCSRRVSFGQFTLRRVRRGSRRISHTWPSSSSLDCLAVWRRPSDVCPTDHPTRASLCTEGSSQSLVFYARTGTTRIDLLARLIAEVGAQLRADGSSDRERLAFGEQTVTSVQLCSIQKKQADGFYKVEHELLLAPPSHGDISCTVTNNRVHSVDEVAHS